MRLVSLALAFALIGGLHLLLARWRWGKAIRATAEDWQAALLTGIDVRRAYLLAFAIGTALAGAAGTLVAIGYSVSPSIGLEWTLKALIVVVLAGLGSMIGTFVGGLVLGVAEAASAATFGGRLPRGGRAGHLRGRAGRASARAVRPVSDLAGRAAERRWASAILAAFAALAFLPLLVRRDDVLNFVFLILLSITLAQSWNIVAGYAGQVNLGHAAFFGLGALVARTLWIGGMPIAVGLAAGAAVVATPVRAADRRGRLPPARRLLRHRHARARRDPPDHGRQRRCPRSPRCPRADRGLPADATATIWRWRWPRCRCWRWRRWPARASASACGRSARTRRRPRPPAWARYGSS